MQVWVSNHRIDSSSLAQDRNEIELLVYYFHSTVYIYKIAEVLSSFLYKQLKTRNKIISHRFEDIAYAWRLLFPFNQD